jgi:prevent-host-death family protein
MRTVNVHEAKTHLSRLLDLVAAGDEVVIAKAGKPIARLVRLKRAGPRRTFGYDQGKFEVPADFDAPLPDEVLAAFEK